MSSVDAVREPVSANPERDGVYFCHGCGNSKHFVGIDVNGFDGECEECDEEDVEAGKECTHTVELTQDFTVIAQDGTPLGADISYHSFAGGGSGSEIGTYTTIKCLLCGTIIYEESGE